MALLKASTLALILAIARVSVAFSDEDCKWPSEFWCSDDKIAMDCGVSWQCESLKSVKSKDAPLVSFELYYESLCPGCRAMITTQLMPTLQKIGQIMNVTFIPYGNAQEKSVGGHWKFTCQHGAEECVGNVIETCVLNLYKQPVAFAFIGCLEASSVTPMVKAAQQCASQVPALNFTRVLECSQSQEGELLEHQMALKTNALQPAHQYVPWVLLNGVHTEDINNKAATDMLDLICDTYTGPKPASCNKQSTNVCRSERGLEQL